MAIILKDDKTFNPSLSEKTGIDMTGGNYYGVIDEIRYTKKNRICEFRMDIFGSKELREGDGVTVDQVVFRYDDSNPDVLAFTNEIGTDGLSIPQAYNKALSVLTDWQSDE